MPLAVLALILLSDLFPMARLVFPKTILENR